LHGWLCRTDHIGPEMRDCSVEIGDGHDKTPVRGVRRMVIGVGLARTGVDLARVGVDEATLDHFENHAAESVEALHPALAFFHALECGAGAQRNLCACGAHVVGGHHNMINTSHFEGEAALLRQGQRCCAARRLANHRWCIINVHYGQPRKVRRTTFDADQLEMLQPWRERGINVQLHITELR